jgi:hypothetical protein
VSDKQIDARLLPIQVGRHTENHPQPSWSLSEIAIRNRSHRRGMRRHRQIFPTSKHRPGALSKCSLGIRIVGLECFVKASDTFAGKPAPTITLPITIHVNDANSAGAGLPAIGATRSQARLLRLWQHRIAINRIDRYLT